MADLENLREHLSGLGRVILGYSGGVDSGLLAVTGVQALGPERFLAVMGRSASYPQVQAEAALQLARQFDIPLLQVHTTELQNPDYLKNSPDRCYFCKSELWTRLESVREEYGFEAVIDGTNTDDLREHRPGARAGGERQVRSPLVELGWTKQDVRLAARDLGLPMWDAPAAPCLSSRVRYGLEVTSERLAQVEEAEAFLRSLGVTGDLRVRHYGDRAKVEVTPAQIGLLRGQWTRIQAYLMSLGFSAVELDQAGYRRGALLTIAPLQAD
jgi:pyridinium-3,5-biscarboxylic acid mononucleotide sulfurtransferase